MIYLDNGATTLIKPPSVKDAVIHALTEYGNPSRGAYPASINGLKAIFKTREQIAELFNAHDSSCVSFTSNVTEALNICAELIVKENDPIITTVFEHNSVLRPLHKRKANIKLVGKKDNKLDYDEIEKQLKDGAKAVFCTHASNLTGDMIDILTVGKMCKKYEAIFVVDSAQTAGIFEIDMQAANIDYLCFTGHKSLFGPQGVGGICVKKGSNVTPVKVGGSGIDSFNINHPAEMPAALEAGTLNTPAICGLSAGVAFINETGLEKIIKHEITLMRMLYNGIKDIPHIKLYGDFSDSKRAPIVTFNIEGIDSGIIAEELWNIAEIAVRSGTHCAPLMHKHLQTGTMGAVRMSLSYFNTEQEIENTIKTVKQISEMI